MHYDHFLVNMALKQNVTDVIGSKNPQFFILTSIKLVIHYLVSFTIDPGYKWGTYFNIKCPVDLTRPLVVLLLYARN